MITPTTKLEELIHIERQAIPSDLCDYIIETIESDNWKPHEWTNPQSYENQGSEKDRELDINHASEHLADQLFPFITNACIKYQSLYGENRTIVGKLSNIRFNRYSENQIMRNHIDHIVSIFDGNDRGIPVLSIIGNLNDDYEGAKLTFWNDYSIDLGKGDFAIWPSLFLYPHRVTEATQGTRYSFVTWAF